MYVTVVPLRPFGAPPLKGGLPNFFPHGAVLVSTGVVRLDKRVVAPDHEKTGNFLNLTDNNTVAIAA